MHSKHCDYQYEYCYYSHADYIVSITNKITVVSLLASTRQATSILHHRQFLVPGEYQAVVVYESKERTKMLSRTI